ncbi:MAG: hypothetical protein KJ574_02380 [Nanoarchaeota archaeon]|nr:hypothetical protein [Nanoarchaeota archaeon]
MAYLNPVLAFFGIVADILVIAAIVYVVIVLKFAQRRFEKSDVLLQFERKRRDEIFQQSLFILAVSILFRFIEENGDTFGLFNNAVLNALFIAQKLFLIFFVLMIMRTTGATKH